MNLVLHQFRTDLRHFRWRLAVLWLAFALENVLVGLRSLSGETIGILHLLVELWQAAFGLGLVIPLVQADALTGSNAAWLARPIRRYHLFWEKTAFIVICLFLPQLACQGAGWALGGYSLQMSLLALEESLLFSLAFVLLVAAMAALTSDLGRFFVGAGLVVGGCFAAALLVEMLTRGGVLHAAHLDWEHEIQRSTSAEIIAWLMLAAGALVAWILQAGFGFRRPAIACLVGVLVCFPMIFTVWSKNFLTPRLLPAPPLLLSLLDTNNPGNVEPQRQVLSQELALAGVPAGQVAVLKEVSARIVFNGDQRATGISRAGNLNQLRPVGSSQQNDYVGIIKGFFPSGTVWFSDQFYGGVPSAFDLAQATKRFPAGLPGGALAGDLTVDLFDVRKVAEQPLRFATFQAVPGVRVTIQRVRLVEGVIIVTLDERTAQLLFDRNMDTAGLRQPGAPDSFCTYVLYHPGTGEGFVVTQNRSRENFPALMSSEMDVSVEVHFPYPALRERLAGVTAAGWLSQARLCVFAPVYAGTSRLDFHDDNFHWPTNYDGNLRRQNEKLNDVQIIAHATLPENPTRAQLDTYLDAILLNVPDNWDNGLRKTIQTKLAVLGTNGLPALLQRLPLAQNLEQSVFFPAISKLITRDQLPDLRDALRRDDNVVEIFVEKHWEADARDILVAMLSDHCQPLNAEALRVVAEAKDPATYSDLRWHFVHLRNGHGYVNDHVVPALEQCPGFDLAGAVREVWQYARLGMSDAGELAIVAAKYGLPDALNAAIAHAETAADSGAQKRELGLLAALTSYSGSTNNTLPWLASNIGHFHFDPSQHRYTLGQ